MTWEVLASVSSWLLAMTTGACWRYLPLETPITNNLFRTPATRTITNNETAALLFHLMSRLSNNFPFNGECVSSVVPWYWISAGDHNLADIQHDSTTVSECDILFIQQFWCFEHNAAKCFVYFRPIFKEKPRLIRNRLKMCCRLTKISVWSLIWLIDFLLREHYSKLFQMLSVSIFTCLFIDLYIITVVALASSDKTILNIRAL